MEKEYIECRAFVEYWNKEFRHLYPSDKYLVALANFPTADVVEVKHGEWALETHSFYRDTFDESCELVVYITASCSECGCKHPNRYEVFSKTLYAPEGADDDFRFDQKAEEEKARAEFTQRNNVFFANYCPHCGAKMRGVANG